MASSPALPSHARVRTGTAGLDDILGGGLPTHRVYMVQGTPGSGKTTLGLRFLIEGARSGESTLYITLSETEEEVRQVAESHGWSLDGIHLYELSAAEQVLRLDQENSLYASVDVELKETVRVLLQEVERLRPARVVLDSLSEIRLLAQSPERYRRQILALKQFFVGRGCTVLLLDDRTGDQADHHLESLCHGVITLQQTASEYGADRRRLRVTKLRGSNFRSGYHDFTVRAGGLEVYPRLVASEHRGDFTVEPLPSGKQALDEMLGGGLDWGTATLLMGSAGVGKSTVALQFACAAAGRGERAAMFLFDERLGSIRTRAIALGMPLEEHEASGLIVVKQIDPAEVAPDEFSARVRAAVEDGGARVVVIDSINGYFTAMPAARYLLLQMHELLSFLAERGVATIMTMAQSGLVGTIAGPVDVSYLADNILLLRYFEARGRMRKAISVLKKRSGYHENTIRELEIREGSMEVGAPLVGFTGILTGVPTLTGGPADRVTGDPSDIV